MQYIEHPFIKIDTIQSRVYQQVLYAAAVKENSLIVLPTGLGKTVVIIMTMAHYLKRDPSAQVVLVAPTRPLVDQHYESCKQFLQIPEEQIVIASGSIAAQQRTSLWKQARVVIATPQTIRNDIINNRVDLSRINLLCFDEAHRAVGDDPYVLTAEQYSKKNPRGRVLGFTASPGKPESLKQMVDNLSINNIEYMDEDHPQVKPYVHDIAEQWVWIALPPQFETMLLQLNQITQDYLKVLKEMDIITSIQIQKNPKRKILTLPKLLNQQRESLGDDKFFAGMSSYGQLMLLTQAVEMLETQGVNTFSKYLENKRLEYEKSRKRSLRKFLNHPQMQQIQEQLSQLQEEEIVHPKVNEIKKIVSRQLETGRDSRILIFCNYKSTIEYLVDHLSEIPEVTVHKFVGQATSSYGKGLTQKEQKEVMDGFRSGAYNVLVSTSVGEEGLDVAQCDLVIFYDLTPSATRLIQRSGRTGRSRAGKVVYLITKGTRDEGYYYASKAQRGKIKQSVLALKKQLQADNNKDQAKLDAFFTAETKKTSQKPDQSTASDTQERQIKSDYVNASDASIAAEKPQLPFDMNELFDAPGKEILIYVDYREKGASLYRELMDAEVQIKQENLPIGDFIVSSEIGVERKTTKDFVQSLIKRNLFEQLLQLKRTYLKPLLIVEGTDLYSSSVRRAAIQGALSAILMDLKIPVMFTADTKETVQVLMVIAKREQLARDKKPSIRKDKTASSTYEEQLYLLSSLPNIDRVLAERIAKYFTSLRDFFNASQDDLRKIHGIGSQIADRIDLLLSTPFEEADS